MKILFCQLRNHGDIIRTFPLMDAIKKIHSDWYIGYTCYPEMTETCSMCKSIDCIIQQPRLQPVTDIQGGTRVLDCSIFNESVEKIRSIKFDVYVDLHGVFQSAMFGTLCDIKVRLGRSSETAKDGASLFYTDVCSIRNKEFNRMERHFKVINKLFPEIIPCQNKDNDYTKSDIITIFPGSSKMGILKRWGLDNYLKLADEFVEKYKICFCLGPEEKELAEKINIKYNYDVLISNDWKSILQQIEKSRFVIGNDGAYLHMAIWKGMPAFIICGPTSAIINGVWKHGLGHTFSSGKCKCPDVWKGICNKKHQCMNDIKVNEVRSLIYEYLQRVK